MTPELTNCEVCGMRWTARRHELCPRCLLADIREDAMKGWAQARGATKARDALQVNYNNLEKERAADGARARETISAVRKRAEWAEKTLAEARAVALEGDGMTHEQALAAVVGLVADLRNERARFRAELERLAHARETAAENLEAKRSIQARCIEVPPSIVREGKGVVEDPHGPARRVLLCTSCGQLPPHGGDEAICPACMPPNKSCHCPGCELWRKAEVRCAELERERDEARNLIEEWRRAMQKQRDSALCVWCEEEMLAEQIRAHVKTCPKGPGVRIAASEARCRELEGVLEDLAHPERRTDCNERKCGSCSTCRARAALAQQGEDARNLDAVGPAREAPSAGQCGCHRITDSDSDYHGCSCEGACSCHDALAPSENGRVKT